MNNNQEAFDKSMKALIKQAFGAVDQGMNCCYRHTLPDGSSCACGVGHLIPDRLYDVGMEGDSPNGLVRYPEIKNLFRNVDIVVLRAIQKAHDVASIDETLTPNSKFLENLRNEVLNSLDLSSCKVDTSEFEKLVAERILELKEEEGS